MQVAYNQLLFFQKYWGIVVTDICIFKVYNLMLWHRSIMHYVYQIVFVLCQYYIWQIITNNYQTITTIKLMNVSTTWHSYHCLCVKTLQIYLSANFKYKAQLACALGLQNLFTLICEILSLLTISPFHPPLRPQKPQFYSLLPWI